MLSDLMLYVITFEDKSNPARVLSDNSIPRKKKALFILKQSWFWSNFILICMLGFSIFLMIKLLAQASSRSKDSVISDWRPDYIINKTHVVTLYLPINIIIVMHTADAEETCYTSVSHSMRLFDGLFDVSFVERLLSTH